MIQNASGSDLTQLAKTAYRSLSIQPGAHSSPTSAYLFPSVRISDRPSSRSSAVASTRSNTWAVATRNRSAGSGAAGAGWPRRRSRGSAEPREWQKSHPATIARYRRASGILPLSCSVNASQVLMGESHNSFAGLRSSRSRRASQTTRLKVGPKPDVRVEQDFHLRSASQSSGSLAGETMSPRILAVPLPEPIQALRSI